MLTAQVAATNAETDYARMRLDYERTKAQLDFRGTTIDGAVSSVAGRSALQCPPDGGARLTPLPHTAGATQRRAQPRIVGSTSGCRAHQAPGCRRELVAVSAVRRRHQVVAPDLRRRIRHTSARSMGSTSPLPPTGLAWILRSAVAGCRQVMTKSCPRYQVRQSPAGAGSGCQFSVR